MLIKILLTLGSEVKISNAFFTVSGVAPLETGNEIKSFQSRPMHRHDLPADIEEVGRITTVKCEHIHGGHRKTSAIDEAPDVPVELDEVEIGLLCFNL